MLHHISLKHSIFKQKKVLQTESSPLNILALFQNVSGMGMVLFASSGEPYTSEERCNDVLDTFSAEDELNCSKCSDQVYTNLLKEEHWTRNIVLWGCTISMSTS